MTRSTKTTGLLLAGAVAVAAAGYSVGSQFDDGSASAAGSRSSAPARFVHNGGGPGDHLSSLADALGVSQAKLRAALDEIRDETDPKPDRDEHLADLAAAIGVNEAQLEAALDKLDPHGDFEADLAKELGVTEDKLRDALRQTRPHRPRALARALGVTVKELRQAFRAVRPERGDRGHHGFDAAALAKELGVEESKVEEAFDKLRAAHEAEHEQRFDAFVKALAGKLGLSEDKVRAALEDARPDFGRGPGHHGPGGP
jgi:lambda repressor-like predicted transcriptional regulator